MCFFNSKLSQMIKDLTIFAFIIDIHQNKLQIIICEKKIIVTLPECNEKVKVQFSNSQFLNGA